MRTTKSRRSATQLRGSATNAIEPPAIRHMPKWARVLLGRARHHTRTGALTGNDLVAMWKRSKGRCAISGLPFNSVSVGRGRARHPFAPSLDRIDPNKGNTPDNVRLVCAVANFAMNAWGLPTLLVLAGAINSKRGNAIKGRKLRHWYKERRIRLQEAEQIAASLSGRALREQRALIAALRRNLTLGPAGLKRAATRAVQSRTTI